MAMKDCLFIGLKIGGIPMCNAGAGNAIGSMFNAYGQVQKGSQTQEEEYQKAVTYDQLSQQAKNEGYLQQEQYSKKLNALEGSQNVTMGSSGLDTSSGTFSKIKTSTARIGQEDLNTIRRNAMLKAWGYDVKSNEAIYKGNKALDEGFGNAFGTILGGGGKGISMGGGNNDVSSNNDWGEGDFS